MRWSVLATCALWSCGRIGFDVPSDDAAAPASFVDDFDRADSTALGTAWDERTSAGSFSIVGGKLVWAKGDADRQETIWAIPSVGSLDQWLCFQLIAIDDPQYLAISVAFRGDPGGFYWALSGHFPTVTPSVGLFERFRDTGFLAAVAADCDGMGSGFAPGDWLCASISGAGAETVARLWRLTADPGLDPRRFPPANCEWAQAPVNDDVVGSHVGLSVWSGPANNPANGSRMIFDNARGGSL